jgi:hypothetical protein
MKQKHFELALQIISENQGSRSIIELGTDASTMRKSIAIKECNATIMSALAKAGFSLYVTPQGVKLEHFGA